MDHQPPRIATWLKVAWAGLIALGAALRLWQYAADASQWVDELAVSRAIADLPPSALLAGPLPYGQVAPPGFLLLEKIAVAVAGAGDHALRLLPLAASLAALVLLPRLAIRLGLRPAAVALALALFALQPELIRYAAQVKPYAVDLAVALALTLLAGSLAATPPPPLRRALGIGAAGVLAVFLSHAAVLVLAGLALGLGLETLLAHRRRSPAALAASTIPAAPTSATPAAPAASAAVATPAALRSPAAPTPSAASAPSAVLAPLPGSAPLATMAVAIGLWGLSAAAASLWAIRLMPPQVGAYLHQFWTPAFAPWPPSVAADVRWAVAAIGGELGAAGLRYPRPVFYAVLAVLGTIALWRRERAQTLLLLGPLAAVLGAAGLGLYPFSSRLVLFIVPALLLAIAAGAETLAQVPLRLASRAGGGGQQKADAGPAAAPTAGAVQAAEAAAPKAGAAPKARTITAARAAAATSALVYLAALWPAAADFAGDPPVYRFEETRPILAAVAARRRPGDAVYVYYGAGSALRFYGPGYGIMPDSYLLGGCHRGDSRAYLRELDRFRGRARLWVLIAHAQRRYAEREALLGYLDHLGVRLLSLRAEPHGHNFGLPGEAFLYDLSRAPRPPGGDAASFPIPPAPHPADSPFACFGSANPEPWPTAAAGAPKSKG